MRTPPEELLVGGQDEHASLLLARSPMPGRAAPPFLLIYGTAEGWCGTRNAPYSRKHWPRPECRYGWFPLRAQTISSTVTIDAVVRLSVEYLAERYDPGLDDHWSRNPSGNEDQHRPNISDAVTNGRAAVVRR